MYENQYLEVLKCIIKYVQISGKKVYMDMQRNKKV